MTEAHAPFERTTTVSEADLDERNHVNNVVYLRWVQEIAIAHWRALAPAEDQETIAWVVRRHEVDYYAPALLGDDIILRTRVGRAERMFFERHTEIVRARDQHLLARARSLWCPVDMATGRPRRPGPEVRALFDTGAASDEPEP